MRQLAVGTNIKMYNGYRATVSWLEQIRATLPGLAGVELFVFPPAVCLPDAQRLLAGTPVGYGPQNMHWAESGPYTGELSSLMLQELGCTHVELGHTERRRYFGETDQEVNLKLKQALKAGLRPVICLGEVEKGSAEDVRRALGKQVETLLAGIGPEAAASFLFAYEPGWAIGVDDAAPASYVQEMHDVIRQSVGRLLGAPAGRNLKIIYGGSVKIQDVGELAGLPDVDGLFVGRSALNVPNFARIIGDALQAHSHKG